MQHTVTRVMFMVVEAPPDNRPQDVSDGSIGDPQAAAKEICTVVELPSGSGDPQALSEYVHRKTDALNQAVNYYYYYYR